MKKLFIWAGLLLVTLANAQQDISVSVIDAETQKPVANIAVTMLNSARNSKIEQMTNAKGSTTFKSIASLDGYVVKFSGNNEYDAQESSAIDIRSNQNSSISLYINRKGGVVNQLNEVVINRNGTAPAHNFAASGDFRFGASDQTFTRRSEKSESAGRLVSFFRSDRCRQN